VEPLTNLINNTPAMSLLFECINTVTQGMLDQPNLVKLSISKLRVFIEDPDQNCTWISIFFFLRFFSLIIFLKFFSSFFSPQ